VRRLRVQMARIGVLVALMCLATMGAPLFASADPETETPPAPATTKPVSKTGTATSVSVSPSEVNPGQAFMVTGSLTGGGRGLVATMVNLSTSYGQIDSVAVTGGDGSFSAIGSIPDGDGFPSSFTVSVSFPGDSLYNGSQGSAKGKITAPPEEPEPEDDPTEEPTEFQSYVAPSDEGPSASPSTLGVAGVIPGTSKHVMLIEIVFLVVAFTAVAILLVVGIVSHGNKALGRGERRGFGSDFGKDAPAV